MNSRLRLPHLSANPFAIAGATLIASALLASAGVDVKELPDRVRVEINGQLFTELRLTGAPHVYYWPLIGPGGVKMTRSWPMEDIPTEAHDHPHHRSLWFAHGLVNGIDFWAEPLSYGKKTPPHPLGKIVHDKVLEARSGADYGVVKTSQKWCAEDAVLLTSEQTLRVYTRPENERVFDFEVVLTAREKEVVFGDTKEGSAALRIAETMRVKQPKAPGQGHMINSEGLADSKVWGQRADWVDMFGPIGEKTFGFAFMDHPKNPRHPTRWHAREYGLFGANPFCEYDMDKTKPKGSGDMKLAPSSSVTFKYRILIHEGAADPARIAERYKEYAQSVP